MKFTLSWLKDHLDTAAPLAAIVDRLTMNGLEVEGVADPAAAFAPFKVAAVISAEKHPNADRLKVCLVDTGEGAPTQVVCGAPNARAGMKGVFAAPGAHIPGTGVNLAKGVIRGVESNGMLLSARELGLSDDHEGIVELPEDAPVGRSFAELLGGGDPVIEVAITPNRADCTGVRGIARDLAAAGIGRLKPDPIRPVPGRFSSPIGVELQFAPGKPPACPAFYGRLVRNVRNGLSPDWLRRRLEAVGLRPINALVDVTNFISLDRGRPLHVYDADKLVGPVRARMGRAGESFLALDGKTYDVDERMCVIADENGVLGLGGVMGGEASGCTEATRNVFVECAYFDPLKIAEAGRRTGIQSDARYRFERGVDPAFLGPGMELATRMILDLCGGEPSEVVIAGRAPGFERVIPFPFSDVERLTGLDLDPAEIRAILNALGFQTAGAGGSWQVSVPSWRADVEGKADLVEEVMRIVGVDRVPVTPLPRAERVADRVLTMAQARRARARRLLAARGMLEAVTWSFVSNRAAALFGGGSPALQLSNPIAADLSDMRPSLLPGLLAAAQRNADRGLRDAALFEVGQIFSGDRPEDQAMAAAGIRRGTAKPDGAGRHWSGSAPPVTAFDAKADALGLLDDLGVAADRLDVARAAPAWYHPGRSGVLRFGSGAVLAAFGEIHPEVLAALDVEGPLVGFEAFLDRIPEPKPKATKSKGPLAASELMPVTRDFAFVVDEAVEAAAILRAARSAEKALVAEMTVFDVFRGEAIGACRKSIAIEVTLQPKERTLTDEEIDAIGRRIVSAVAKATGASLRA